MLENPREMGSVMELLAGIVLALLVVAGIVVWLVRAPAPELRERGSWHEGEVAARRIALDLGASDPDHPSVERLVQDVARRALREDPELDEVEVTDRDGTVLGRLARPSPLAPGPTLPEQLHEPRARTDHTPRVVGGPSSSWGELPEPDQDVDISVPGTLFADRFDLPDHVRRRVTDPERPIEVVRAILEAAGRPVHLDRDVAVTGDTAIAIVSVLRTGEELSEAFMRVHASGAARGVIIRLAYADPELIRHREAAAPHVRHVTAEGIQRMADAVEAGGDPVEFAAGPVVLG